MSAVIRIATRQSMLAMWQARHVKELLEQANPGLSVELLPMLTRGDKIIDQPLAAIGGKGLFLKELEHALLNDEADLAVHSMKDVPALMADGLKVDVVLPRADPRDALLSNEGRDLSDLPSGALVGTSSLRRQCQLKAARPDLRVTDLRGNVDTRLRKLDEGQYQAIILACAGLERLGLGDRITQALPSPQWLPASTQGIIGLQQRSDDQRVADFIAPLNDAPTHVCALAERRVAGRLEASCQLPIAVHAQLGDQLQLHALVGMPDGTGIIRASAVGSDTAPEQLGDEVARKLLEKGAAQIIEALG
ncbi:MAG: hydroxymethylbilane synthase [Xanthomonadales bacterium]|nr:hydroxymethylbilane synthase [Gammaproteobacteria bacterium]NNL94753.1 hydroxymethylbilane synthase [Xanthomonadales bacterium]